MLSLNEAAEPPARPSRAAVSRHDSALGRWEYARSRPAPALLGIARTYVGWIEDMPAPLHRRELPTDEAPLIFNFGAPFHLFTAGNDSRGSDHTSFVTGAYDTFQIVESAGASSGIQVNLTILGMRLLVGRPIADLTNLAVHPADVFGAFADELADRLRAAPSWDVRFDMLDAALLSRIATTRPLPPPIGYAWRRLQQTSGRLPIGDLVADVGWSHRHFIARFTDELGISPKVLARLLRFSRLVADIRGRRVATLAGAAIDAGYYDQSHLHRDVRAFAGATPAALVASLLPDGGGFLA